MEHNELNELKERLDKLEKYVYEELPTYLAQELRRQLNPIEKSLFEHNQTIFKYIQANNK